MIKLFALLIFCLPHAFAGPKEDTLALTGKFSYEVSYFPEEKFQHLVLEAGETERMTKEHGYRELYQRYLTYGAKAQIEEVSRAPASVMKDFAQNEALSFPVKQNLGLVAFKRGDLAAACPKVVETAKALGVDRIAYFHPVHFSGGNSKTYRMPEDPVYGKHWRYEVANNFSQTEFEACLDLIAARKLKLHYIPHLESIAALVSAAEEWRMLSGIPIDNWYFHHAFGPLLTYLKKRPKNFRETQAIDITLAAEVDPMVLKHARKVRAGKAWLESQLAESRVKGTRYFLNTNGDFYHGKDLLNPKTLQCEEITNLFREVDALTPSMYGDKGHLSKKDGKLDLALSVSSYKDALGQHLAGLCPLEKAQIGKIVSSAKIGFGEFAVDATDREQSYRDLLRGAEGQLLFVQYWNHGKWDHLGILEPASPLREELVTKKPGTPK